MTLSDLSSNASNAVDTIAAIATAPGGAIGIIRLSGPESISATNSIFSKDINNASGYSLHYGSIIDKTEGTRGIIDEVLVSVFRAPHSYTGEDSVEISCHGSSYVLRQVMQLLYAQGVRQADHGEFTQRAFLNGKLDLAQAEAVADLIASTSKASHKLAINQMKGGVSKELNALRDQLLNLTSLIELELDFSEEEVEFANREQLLQLCKIAQQRIDSLRDSFQQGNAIKEGVPVAIIGAPNVGKSTLLNALLKEDKAIVSNIEGTTRDIIEDTIQIQGITFRFIDTAGIRHTDNEIEQIGITRAQQAASKAKIIIMMSEESVPEPNITITDDQTVIHVVNKSSIVTHTSTPLHIEALYNKGIDKLEDLLVSCISTNNNDAVIINNIRHYEALTSASTSLGATINSIQANMPTVLIAEELRQSISHLEHITGQSISSLDVLHNIFQHFCIGK